ncbi:hypothetical protein DQ04_11691010, partial [Trypanosoma grayi]|uniref:hypothetical protein n=1 Tax=Trypanosoma grayi TaxID=71804 RepID=UPI0004F49E42
ARAVGLTLLAFKENLPAKIHICADSTTVMHSMPKGSTHSDAPVGVAGHIDRALRGQGLHATWGYVASEKNPADGIPRGVKVLPTDIAKGRDLRRGCGGRVKGAFSTFFLSVLIHDFNPLYGQCFAVCWNTF